MLPKIPPSTSAIPEPVATSAQTNGRNPRQDKRGKLRVVRPEDSPEENRSAAEAAQHSPIPHSEGPGEEIGKSSAGLFTQIWLSITEVLKGREPQSPTEKGTGAYQNSIQRGKSSNNLKKGAIVDENAG